MSKRLTMDEKRKKAVEYFHETNDYYTLKELEKSLPKVKGIVGQTVKEVIEGLVADGLVTTEKVGTSNYYWSYPGQATLMVTNCLTPEATSN